MTLFIKTPVSFFRKPTSLSPHDNDYSLSSQARVEPIEKIENVVKEVPVALVYNGISHTVMMCTPSHLEEFALGFSLTEGIIQQPKDIYHIDIVEVCNGIEVQIELSSRCFMQLKQYRRSMVGRTGCGICGTEQLAQINKNFAKVDRSLSIHFNLLDPCLQQLEQAQQLGQQTGATHAVAFFNPQAQLLAIREDVGRHVALDKLLGWHARQSKPQGFILTTSRASYEMVQKTVSCGIELLLAISAATDLAIQMATQSDLTLIGFTRFGRATVYCGKERLVFE